MSGIIFDLDGTLIDSAPEIHAASVTVMQAHGMDPLSFQQVRGFIGNGVGVLISRCIATTDTPETPDLHAAMSRDFHEIYESTFGLTTLYPNVEATLRALHADGFRLGLCTNKPEGPTHAVLAHFGLTDLFHACAYGDGPYPRKPDPAPVRHVIDQMPARHFLYVGDSEVDAETAENAGLPMALFTPGYRKTPVEDLYHDARFDDFNQLRPIIEAIAPLPD